MWFEIKYSGPQNWENNRFDTHDSKYIIQYQKTLKNNKFNAYEMKWIIQNQKKPWKTGGTRMILSKKSITQNWEIKSSIHMILSKKKNSVKNKPVKKQFSKKLLRIYQVQYKQFEKIIHYQ